MKNYSVYLCLIFLISFTKYVSSQRKWLKEGELCMDGPKNGTCTAFKTCQSKNPHRSLTSYYKCSLVKRVHIVCCPNESQRRPKSEVSRPVTDPVSKQLLYKIGQKAWDKCLDYLRNVNYACKGNYLGTVLTSALDNKIDLNEPEDDKKRVSRAVVNIDDIESEIAETGIDRDNKTIVNGKDARETQFPHMALLGYGEEWTVITWMCGGSLISDRFVLTGAHCISNRYNVSVKHIALGILRRSELGYAHRYLVSQIIPHPNYQSPNKYNDIALLKTDRIVTFSPKVSPACLAIDNPPQGRRSNIRRNSASVTGWGLLGSDGRLANTLQMAYLKEFSYNECENWYPVHRHMINGVNHSTQVCYGDEQNARDTCRGDSGGPLQIPGQASDCQYSIIGVTSYGFTCPSPAGIYTRVRAYIPWIESIVWP